MRPGCSGSRLSCPRPAPLTLALSLLASKKALKARPPNRWLPSLLQHRQGDWLLGHSVAKVSQQAASIIPKTSTRSREQHALHTIDTSKDRAAIRKCIRSSRQNTNSQFQEPKHQGIRG